MKSDPVMDRLRRANPVEIRPVTDESSLLSNILARLGDPRLAGQETTRRPRRRAPTLGAVFVGLSVAIAVGVAILAVAVLGHKPAVSNTGHGTALGTARVIAQAPDPSGGLPWGLRAVHTERGQICLQVGRLQGGRIGVLGQDGAWANDHGFHPIPTNGLGFGGNLSCGAPDRNGHAFINISDDDAIANASGDASVNGDAHRAAAGVRLCSQSSSSGRPRATLPPPCPKGVLRDLEYGLLGPDATSITYIDANATHHTQPTSGPDGAYLIVRPQASCVQAHAGSTATCSLGSAGPLLQAGVIIAVTYRNGRVCHLPAPDAGGLVRQASCPLVGYQSPPIERVTKAQLTAPVTTRVLPASHYCNSTGHNIPGCKQVTLSIAFTARIPVSNANSYYEAVVDMPPRHYTPGGPTGCPGAEQGVGPTRSTIRAGQHLNLRVAAPARSHWPGRHRQPVRRRDARDRGADRAGRRCLRSAVRPRRVAVEMDLRALGPTRTRAGEPRNVRSDHQHGWGSWSPPGTHRAATIRPAPGGRVKRRRAARVAARQGRCGALARVRHADRRPRARSARQTDPIGRRARRRAQRDTRRRGRAARQARRAAD
jgi:hypothetical protein